jgi:hypothetical protein
MAKILLGLLVLVVTLATGKRLQMKLRGFTLALMFFLLASFALAQYATPVPQPPVASAEMHATTLHQRIAQQGGPSEVGVYSSNSFVSLVSPTTFTCPASSGANPVPSNCLVTVTVVAEMDNSDPRSAGTYGVFRIDTLNDPSITNVNKGLTSFDHVWRSDSNASNSSSNETTTRSFTFLLSVRSGTHTFLVELGCLNATGGDTCYQGTFGDDPFDKTGNPVAKGGPAISVITDVFKPAL